MLKPVFDLSPVSQATQTFESTATLLRKVKQGDDDAKERLFAIYLPLLTRWAHGRLPAHARSLSETADMVQLTLFKALQKLPEFEHRGEGAFLAYLRQVLLNSVRKEIQKQQRRHKLAPMDSEQEVRDAEPSVLDQVMGQRLMAAYESALQQLSERDREAVILRLELDFSFPEIAEAMDLNSANAARMLVTRSFDKLASHMPHVQSQHE
nr:sigma-70 family RNA polymerase sigma factor [Marinicella sp. NBU2979]